MTDRQSALAGPGTRALAAALALLATTGCDKNLVPDPDVETAALPREADVAVGATHDILLVACEDTVTLADLFSSAVDGAIFVGFGRRIFLRLYLIQRTGRIAWGEQNLPDRIRNLMLTQNRHPIALHQFGISVRDDDFTPSFD